MIQSDVEPECLPNHTSEDFTVSDLDSSLIFSQELTDIQKNTDLCTFVVVERQLGTLSNPLIIATAIAVACRDSDVRNVKALIIGPPETPYEFGFFDVGG